MRSDGRGSVSCTTGASLSMSDTTPQGLTGHVVQWTVARRSLRDAGCRQMARSRASVSAEPAQIEPLPLLLVDIDGVISLWGGSILSQTLGALTLVDGVPHQLSRIAAAQLAGLADVYEIVWCSGWEDRADDHLPRLVGLGPFPHLSFGPHGDREHWKLAAIDAFAGPDRPLAWIDDDLPPPCHAWAATRSGPTLLVTTDPAVGATAAHAARLRAWALAPT